MDAKIKFPAAEFCPRGKFVCVVVSYEEFSQCNGLDLKRSNFDDMELVDSSGNAFQENGIVNVQPASPWWKWPYEWVWFNCRRFNITVDLSNPAPICLDAFKEKINTYIDLDRGMWESGIGVAEIKEEVRKAKTHREAIEVIYGQTID